MASDSMTPEKRDRIAIDIRLAAFFFALGGVFGGVVANAIARWS